MRGSGGRAGEIPRDAREGALLLTGELVTNSVRYGRPAPAIVGVLIDVARDRVRVEISDTARTARTLRPPAQDGGDGLTLVDALAARWHAARDGERNVTWFELDLPGTRARTKSAGRAIVNK